MGTIEIYDYMKHNTPLELLINLYKYIIILHYYNIKKILGLL